MDSRSSQCRRGLKSAQEQKDQRRHRNERERARHAAETAETRSEWLRKQRERDCARCAAQTASERQATSQQKSTRERERMAAETPEERQRTLQRMSTNQHERLAVETPEERELRLDQYSTRYREQQSVQPQLPLLQQCSIQAKMHKFHVNMATLDTPTCSTCSERFPGLHFHSTSNECMHCSRDKHIPKLYSSANNMNPGPIPPQLQVVTQHVQ